MELGDEATQVRRSETGGGLDAMEGVLKVPFIGPGEEWSGRDGGGHRCSGY
jgi:hypothetical protein